MNKINMPHFGSTPRLKPLEEVQAMIQQYEEQIASSENELALSLMTHKLNELKGLVKSNDVKR